MATVTYEELCEIERRSSEGTSLSCDVRNMLKFSEECLQRLKLIASRPCWKSLEAGEYTKQESGHGYACGTCVAKEFLDDLNKSST